MEYSAWDDEFDRFCMRQLSRVTGALDRANTRILRARQEARRVAWDECDVETRGTTTGAGRPRADVRLK